MSKITILALTILCVGCVTRYSNISPHHDVLVDFQTNNQYIEITDLSIIRGDVSLKDGHYKVIFESLLGGGERILGYTYKSTYADTYKGRLKVRCRDTTIIKLTVEELLAWKINVIGTDSIYVAPKLCQDFPSKE